MGYSADPTRRRHEVDAWDKRFIELDAFVRSEGRMPNSHFANPHERSLRSWISTQRLAHSGLGTAVLTPDQQLRLQSIPGWEW
jgi:hypothetical protein